MRVEAPDNKQLERFSSIAPESILKLSKESFWVGLKTKSGFVEGKLYLPKQPNGSILLFEPGFPGDASTRLDRLWAKSLVDAGYTIFAVRHNGTIVNGEYSDDYVSCPERQEQTKTKEQEILGKKSNPTIEDWLKEPLVMMEAFSSSFKDVVLAGHSFGTLAILSSLIDYAREHPQLAKRISRVVSLAGTVGKYTTDEKQPMKNWGEYIDTEIVRKKIKIGDVKTNLNALRNAYIKIHNEAASFPKYADFLFVIPEGDELVEPIEVLDMISTLGKGYLIIDQGEKGDSGTGRLAHDMDNLKPETFAQLLDKNWCPQENTIII